MEDCDEALGIIVTSYSSELQALTVFGLYHVLSAWRHHRYPQGVRLRMASWEILVGRLKMTKYTYSWKILTYRIYFIKRPGRLLDFWTYNLRQNRWKICTPLPPKSRMGKWRGFILDRSPSWWAPVLDHDLGVMGICWHFIRSKIVGGRLFQAGRLFNFSPVSSSSYFIL